MSSSVTRIWIVLGVTALFLFCAWRLTPTEPKLDEERIAGTLRVAREGIRERDATIQRLKSRIAELEAQVLALMNAAESEKPAHAVDDEEVDRPEENTLHPPPRSPALRVTALWLRELLPEKFGDATLHEIRYLRELDLKGAELTDEDLAYLGAMESLAHLDISGTQVSDAGLRYLEALERLTHLDISSTGIAGEGLAYLPPSLESLHMSRTSIDDTGLDYLPDFDSLGTLKLNHTRISDDSVPILESFPSLSHLEVDGSALSREGVAALLDRNPSLTRLEIRDGHLSLEAARELADAYPECNIVIRQGSPGVRYDR